MLVKRSPDEELGKIGLGEGKTKWKGCAWKRVLAKLVIIAFIYLLIIILYISFPTLLLLSLTRKVNKLLTLGGEHKRQSKKPYALSKKAINMSEE